MASWIDVFSLVMTTLFFVGSILGVLYASRAISARLQSVKTSLENRGVAISREGVSLKTLKRFDQEDYVDATQRGLVKILGAVTVGPEAHKQAFLQRSHSNGNSTSFSTGEHAGLGHEHEKEKHVFGVAMRRSQSNEHGKAH